jgi:adenylate cyclase
VAEEPSIIPLEVRPLFSSNATSYVQALIALVLCNEDNAQTISLLLRNMSLVDFQKRAIVMLTETCSALLVHCNLSANQEIPRYSAQWLAIIQQFTESSRATLYLPHEGELVSRMSTLTTPFTMPVGSGVPGWCFEQAKSILTNDPYNDPRFNPVFDKRFKLDTSSVLCVPAFLGDKLIGVLELANKNFGGYVELDEELARRACSYVAAGLLPPTVQAKLAYHEGAERRMAEALVKEHKQQHMATLVAEIVGSIGAITECERSTLFLHDTQRNTLWTGFVRGGTGIEVPDTAGIAGACFSHNVMLNISDCYQDPRFNTAVDKATGYKTRCMLCAPVLHAVYGRPVGVLQVINKISSTFTRQDEAQTRQLCSMVSAVVLASDSLSELALAEDTTTRLFTALSIATVLFDMSGTCVRVNRDAIDLFFLERAEQWVGKKAQPIFGKANRKLYRLYEATRRTETTCMHEVRVYPSVGDSDGVVRFVRFEPFKLPSGEVVGVSVSLMPTVQDGGTRRSHRGRDLNLGSGKAGEIGENQENQSPTEIRTD